MSQTKTQPINQPFLFSLCVSVVCLMFIIPSIVMRETVFDTASGALNDELRYLYYSCMVLMTGLMIYTKTLFSKNQMGSLLVILMAPVSLVTMALYYLTQKWLQPPAKK